MWEKELQDDKDSEFILDGIRNGFKLVDVPPETIERIRSKNHYSALKHRKKVEEKIREEISEGNYVITDDANVTLVSPLAAIEKADGSIRLLHDLSFPGNKGLNAFADKEQCKYETVDEIVKTLEPGAYMAKVDLKWAYRSIPICKEHQTLTGLQWTFHGDTAPTTLVDTALGMGARKSPAHFNRITQAIKRSMVRRNFHCHAYLDDFLVHDVSREKCALAIKTLITLLRSLGLYIAWPKISGVTQKLVYLGIEIDTLGNQLSLDPDKIKTTMDKLNASTIRKRVSRKQVEKLCGSLIWACNVIPCGKVYVNCHFQALRSLKAPNHKMLVPASLQSEWTWWISTLAASYTHRRQIWPAARSALPCMTDSCSSGGGMFLPSFGLCSYVNWILDRPEIASCHINVKELAIVEESVALLAPLLPGRHLQFLSDNSSTVHWINRWTSRSPTAVSMLKHIAALATKWNLTVSAVHIPGCKNEIADAISRLHRPGEFLRLNALMCSFYGGRTLLNLPCHMSPLAAYFLFSQVLKIPQNSNSWIMR